MILDLPWCDEFVASVTSKTFYNNAYQVEPAQPKFEVFADEVEQVAVSKTAIASRAL